MPNTVTLLSLNCEAHKHVAEVSAYLAQTTAEVVCMQEVFACDLPAFEAAIGAPAFFIPTSRVEAQNRYGIEPRGEWGIAMFSHLPILERTAESYIKHGDELPFFVDGQPNSGDRLVMGLAVEKGGQDFRILNTHFTWTPDGQASEEQHQALENLLRILEKYSDFVICGDFNAPRGGEIYSVLAEKFIDHMPAEVTTTIDGEIHHAGDLKIVVDTFFSTLEYTMKNVRAERGGSDHLAILCEVEKA